MGLFIRNKDAVDIEIDDLGITVPAGTTISLLFEAAEDVQSSARSGGDLFTEINTPNRIVVLDPLDDVTELDAADGVIALRAHNNTHWRIAGGTLNQLEDVSLTLTGSPPTPTLDEVLQYNGSEWTNQVATANDIDRVQVIHVGKHGNDSNDGLTPNKAKLTFTAAIASALSSPQQRFTIWCEDSGTYTESFTVPSQISVEAVDATINGTVTLSDNTEFTIREVIAPINTSAVIKTSGSGSARINAEILRATGTGDTVTTQPGESGVLLCYARQVFTENGGGIVDNSTSPAGHIHVEIEDLYITGSGSGLDRSSSTGLIVGRVAHIIDIGGSPQQGVGIDVTSGRVDAVVGVIDTPTAYRVTGAGTLKMFVTDVMRDNAARVQTSGDASVDVIEANVLRWITIDSSVSPYTARRVGFISVDTTGGPVTINLPFPPSDGDNVSFQDGRNNFSNNSLFVSGNGAQIELAASSPAVVEFDVSGTAGVFVYNGTIEKWNFSRIQEEVAFSPSTLIYVTKNGNDTTGTGSFSNPFLTIKRGVDEALSRVNTSPPVPTTVKVLDGIYDEINPIQIVGPNSEFVQVQGEQEFAVIVRPTIDTENLFELQSNDANDGPVINRMSIWGTDTFKANGQAGVKVTGEGRFVIDKVNILNCGIGIDAGNDTSSPGDSVRQETVYDFATIENCGIGIDAKGDGILATQVSFLRRNGIALQASDSVRVELGNWSVQGENVGSSPVLGTGFIISDDADVIATGGTISNLGLGVEVNDTSNTTFVTTTFINNTIDYEQMDPSAILTIQGVVSRTRQIVADGATISLNYIDRDTGDFIVGNVDSTGSPLDFSTADPGLQFRVRDIDGRVFIGDQAENFNAPTNTVGGSRTVNLIDTNGNFRIWRWQEVPGLHPAFEWVKGVNTFIADDEGDAPITAITAATDTITIDLSGADYNDPLDPVPGSDRTTLDRRIFFPGAELRINGTASNDGDYVVSSSTYNPGAETIDVVLTTDITVSEGAGGEAVFGGGAGRPDGVSTYVDDPTAAISAGVGDVHWDMLLRETDSFAIRRRTGGSGKEHFRFFRDRTEIQHGPAYDGSDNNLVVIFEGTAGTTGANVEYFTFRNANGTVGSPSVGPEIEVIGGGTNIDFQLIPKGTGTVKVPSGYENNVVDDSLITKAYVDGILATAPVVQARRTTTFAVPVTPTWGDITFDTTDVETDPTIVEHNNTSTQVIDVKEDGLYSIQYVVNTDDESLCRLVSDGVGGTTVIPGSLIQVGDTGDVNDVIVQNSPVIYAELSAGDEIVVQAQASTGAETIIEGSLFTIQRLSGVKGDKGEPGSGTTIDVEQDDITVGMVDTINFEGNGVSVVSEGGSPPDKATITINRDFLHRHNGAGTQTLTGTPVTLLFGTNIRSDANYAYSAGEITITDAGWYRITYDISADGTTGTRSIGRFFLENNTVLVAGSDCYTYNRNTAAGENTVSATVLINASASDVIRIRGQQFAGANVVTVANSCRLTIESLGS